MKPEVLDEIGSSKTRATRTNWSAGRRIGVFLHILRLLLLLHNSHLSLSLLLFLLAPVGAFSFPTRVLFRTA